MNVSSWLGEQTMQAVGWSLVHFLWIGAAIAAVLYACLPLLRTASMKYAAAVGALVLMTAAPIATFLFVSAHPDTTVTAPLLSRAVDSLQFAANSPALSLHSGNATRSVDWLSGVVWLWFTGVMVFSLRALGGWLMLEQMRREKTALDRGMRILCSNLQRTIGLTRTIEYFQSNLIDSPAVVGWIRPIVLIPMSTISGLSADQLEAVIVHELAHIKRFDGLVNLFQIAAEAVLFYHPAIWWVNRIIRAERENCCDDYAVAVCGSPFEYAKALTVMETWRTAPAMMLAANSGHLKARIGRLLGFSSVKAGVPRAGLFTFGLLFTVGALLAGTQLSGTIEEISYLQRPAVAASALLDPEPEKVNPIYDAQPPRETATAVTEPDSIRSIGRAEAKVARTIQQVARATSPRIPMSARVVEGEEQTGQAQGHREGSYIDEMNAAGFKNLSVDDLVALKVQGITPEYVREMRAAGLDPNVHQLIAMKVQGVDPQWVKEIRATGLNPSLSEMIAMKIQGVSADYVRQAMTHGLKNENVGEIIAMKIQGVNPSDAEEYRKAGLDDISLHQIIAMRIQGVTPEYVKQMRAEGFKTTSTHEFLEAKIQGVTPDFVRQAKSHGFTDLTAHKLIALKMADVF